MGALRGDRSRADDGASAARGARRRFARRPPAAPRVGVDIYATVVDAAGARDDAAAHHPHGQSLLDPVLGRDTGWRDSVVMESFGLGHLPTTAFTLRHGRYKYGFNFCGRDELYDLQTDPHETTNLIDDSSTISLQHDLLERIARWMEQTDYHPHGIREFRSARLAMPMTH